MHIVLINPSNGKIEFAQIFDTHMNKDSMDVFMEKRLPLGFIVIAACKDECSTRLSRDSKKWFEYIGSKLIKNVKYRLGFCFIGVVG